MNIQSKKVFWVIITNLEIVEYKTNWIENFSMLASGGKLVKRKGENRWQ